MAKYVDRHSPYASTRAQWGYFKALTGHELPRGISKSAASKLIDQAKRGEWKPPIRHIRVGRHQFWYGPFQVRADQDANGNVDGGWRVWIAYRIEGPKFETQEAALVWANAQARDGETVEISDSIYTQVVD